MIKEKGEREKEKETKSSKQRIDNKVAEDSLKLFHWRNF